MKKSSNYFSLVLFIKKFLKYFFQFIFKSKKNKDFNYEENWKNKSSINLLNQYWEKKNNDIFLTPLINFIKKNHIKNILEIGCAAGGNLKFIKSNCDNIENLYGTDFNKNFIDFGKNRCRFETINNINLLNVDIKCEKIYEFIKDKKIDLVITIFTLSQLKNAEEKIIQVFNLINKINPNYLYFAELFDLNNKVKIFKLIHENEYPDRIILKYGKFRENLSNYNFNLLKENYNNCAVKFSHISCNRK